MTRSIAPLNCPFHNKPRNATAAPGYALLVLMIMVAVLLVTVTAALPSVYQEGQREREAGAIFYGNQYARAVYLFYRRFGRYPASVKDLLNTDGTRFLRRPYRDPLARNGKWRFIHAAAGGILLDSWNKPAITPGAAPGAGSPASGMQASASTTQPAAAATNAQNGGAKHPPSTCDSANDESTEQFAGSTYQTGTLTGAYIVGVAPCSDKASIRVVNQQDHYDHWEFLGLNYREYSLPKSAPAGAKPASTSPLQTPTQNGQQPAQQP
ncbi:MAG: hypothetical protein ACRD3D_17090 [Terriglobia bacterium]